MKPYDYSSLIVNFKKNLFDDHLSCGICHCFFTFAHTLVDCGHTFCRRCIYQYFKKSKTMKCPHCGEKVESNFRKSVKRDPYKQSLVDLLHPEFLEKDNLIISRCRKLFPDIDLQAIKNELDWDLDLTKERKKALEDNLQINLNDEVLKLFGVSLEIFAKNTLDDDEFDKMVQKKNAEKKPEEKKDALLFFTLYPKSDEDLKIVGIKNALSVQNSKSVSVLHLKKLLVNEILKKNSGVNASDTGRANIAWITLSLKERMLGNSESITEIKREVGEKSNLFIYYEVLKENLQ